MARERPPALDEGPPPKGSVRQIARLIALLRPHRGRFVVATIALLVGSGLGLVYPQAARRAVDMGIAEGGSLEALDKIGIALVVIFIAHAGVTWVRHYLMSWLGERVVADLRRQVFDRLLGLELRWFQERRTGEIVGRLASDVTVVEGVVGSELSIALRNAVQLVGGLALLFIENARLTLIMLGVIPPLVVGAVIFGRRIRRMSKLVQDRLADASAQVDEAVGAISTVQAFVQEKRESGRYAGGVELVFQEALRLARWRASFMSTMTLGGFLAIAGIIWVGGRAVVTGDLSPGDLTAFMLYTMMVAASLGSIAGLWGTLQRAAGATERLFAIIDTIPDLRDPDAPIPLPGPDEASTRSGSVRFEGVSFRYPTRPDHPVVDDIDLEIAPGEVVALVGPSGSGKTTLTALLLRFFDVDKGKVEVDGIDVRDVRLAELRGAMAVVAQEPVLFSGSIRENLTYGSPDATDDEVIAAARDAHAHDFIEDFPEGYDTLVGERGVKLSGGQRQRLAIARALLCNPRVLILDEATSNLDAESEALVQEALARLMVGRTTLVIAHRLSTVRDADRIVVLDKGSIVESGDHKQLMDKAGVYQRLVEHQVIREGAAEAAPLAAAPAA